MWNSHKFKCRKSKLWALSFALLATSYGHASTGNVVSLPLISFNKPQQEVVKGKVTDSETGAPVTGATISIKGTTEAVQTDRNGAFSITAGKGQVLVASFIGYESIELPVTSSTLNFSLTAAGESLDEVVVVGYGTQKKKEITSAVASVKEEDFNKGGMRNPLELIQGKVAGLNITRQHGSNPNSGTGIQLRGMSSVKGSLSPLVVIDGIPGGNLDLVKQGDIESIDVLKDGSAAAIYGTRGNNGVILVTTKKGKGGAKPQFEYFTYGQREFVARKPNMLSASQFRDRIASGDISDKEDFGASTDLFDELVDKNNFSHFHNFAASGSGENSHYRVSLNYEDANGIALENGKKQFGGRMSFSQTGLQDRLTFDMNMAGNFNKANLLGGKADDNGNVPDFEQAVQRNPTAPLYSEDGSFYQTQAYNNYNPLSRYAYRTDERDQQTFSADARVKVKILDELSWTGFGSYVRDNYNDRRYRSTLDWDQRPTSDYQGMGYAYKGNFLEWTKTFETMLDYNKTFNEKHHVTGLLGYSYQYHTLENFEANNNGFTTDGFLDWNLGSGTALTNDKLPRPGMGSFKEDNTLIAFFGRVNYNFNDKYFVTGILRREGSSRFGVNNKWGNFPAISAGWTITNEDFFTNKDVVNDLKIRLGYGVTGNQDIGNYQSLITLGTGGVYPQNGVYYQTYGPKNNPNPDLRWEQKEEWNLGFDFGLFNNKITGALDLYNRNTKDLLFDYTAQMPSYLSGGIFTNVGAVNNKGIELQLSATAMQREEFSWTIDFTGSYQKYKLTKLSSDIFKSDYLEFGGLPSPGNLGSAIRLEEGTELGSFYGKRFAGISDEGKWLFYKADGTTGLAGEMNNDDLTYIGNGVPKYQMSLGNRFTYKGFDLSIFFRGKFQFDILNTPQMYFANKKWLPNNVLEDAFTTHGQLNDDPQYSDYYLENGSFVKLDNVTLGYNFKMNNDYVRNLYVYVTGRNIATITGYSGLDPEIKDTGFDAGIDWRGFYPRTKSWSIGLNVGF
ncbi:SusC/RagA family TonB-linked outer membrane protein [Sphingobacterium shayense]|uniref:SusC/RagA family TonB-linked outer membrane protein n=1 Tax=Sphingobacterium shayense TaxID=626343 RepID=UPI001551A49D|nr:SusC/RagA family TonB-linked outer membrane protein [Sphingobacterium shayense]NQD71223.1 SusC/RagA family TonB-linked outer membrane protein [Sphingobacterium shayense]